MIGIDTNVLLRWLLADDPGHKEIADEFMAELTPEEPGFVSLVSMVEIAWVLGSVHRMSRSRVLDVVENLLMSDELEFDEGEGLWRALLAARDGADFADALIADTADLFGCDEVVTFDRQAADCLGMRLLS